MNVVVANAEVDLLEPRFLGDQSSDVVAALLGEAAGVEDESKFAESFEVEDRVAEILEGKVRQFVVREVEVKSLKFGQLLKMRRPHFHGFFCHLVVHQI